MSHRGDFSTTKRAFLKLFGSTVGVGSLLVGTATVRALSSPGNPGTVIDLGEKGLEPGMDLAPWLNDCWEPGYEVHVPGGHYALSDPGAFGIVAEEHAWLVGDGEVVADHGSTRVEFDLEARGETHVRAWNFTLRGVDTGDNSKIRARARDASGLVEYIDFDRPDGSENGTEGTGFYVPHDHAGTARFVNCHVEGFSDNGLYSDNAEATGGENGPVEVYGGLYRNNDVSGVRLSSDESVVQSVAVVNDGTAPTLPGGDYTGVQRGIRIRHAGENIRVDDCDVYHTDEPGVAGPFEVEDDHEDPPFGSGGSTRVTSTRIHNDIDDTPAINRETDAYDLSGDTIDLTGDGDLSLDGDFANVTRGPDATEPTREERVYDWNDPPTAAFAYSPSSPYAGQSVAFDGTVSTDDSGIVAYEWDFDGDDSVDATGSTTSHAFPTVGDHPVTLTVTDDEGQVDRVTETVTVGPAPVCEGCPPPQDLDGDGKYEDLDGDGEITFADINLLYSRLVSGEEPVEPFDFNGNGELDFGDVNRLYEMMVGSSN